MASYTKELTKRLPKMTQADKECMRFALDKQLEVERNPLVKSSIKQRLEMLNRALGTTYPGQVYKVSNWAQED